VSAALYFTPVKMVESEPAGITAGFGPGLTPAPKIVALNAWIKRYAASVGAVYLDYHTAMKDARDGLPPELAADGVHPTEAGYRIMAPLAARAIAEALR